jgi:alpha-glucosidase
MSATDVAGRARTELSRPHHDGSERCVVELPGDLGEDAVVRLCVPDAASVGEVLLRYVVDGEPRVVRAEVDEVGECETWWRAAFPVRNPDTNYRWLLAGHGGRNAWLNGLGLVAHDVPDADDFIVSVDRGGPEWHLESVVYEIFPDRFASSGARRDAPAWAIARAWDELPVGRGPETPFEWFGGDLPGIEEHLDHIEALGAAAIYLTPIFPAGSTHRYDATSFEHVDPLLGGDEALASLVGAAHARGLRVVGDLTLNHVGDRHDWFVAARNGRAPERDFFFFDESLPSGYESWLGVASLPKLDWRSEELRRRMLAILRRWVEPPFSLDGWRIDVANMTGRRRDLDANHEVAHAVRAAVGDGLLVGEHAHDARADLRAGGWHGTMNYAGSLRPIWWWLRSEEFADDPFLGAPAARLDGRQTVATMRAFRAGMSWAAVLHSWVLLDSHDTARFQTVAGSRDRHLVGLGLLMTTPGVPMVFAGAELGLEGEWGEDARRTMPWARPETWDAVLLEEYRRLIALRRSSSALARGGIRYAFVDEDVIAYLRETTDERLLCLASRAPHEPVRLPLVELRCEELETVHGGDVTYDGGDAALPAEGPVFHIWRLKGVAGG